MRNMLGALTSYIHETLPLVDALAAERKRLLDPLSDYVRNSPRDVACRLIFICTHNSRRSHISQIWAQVAAYYYGLEHIQTYSGGTEATAFHPNAVAAMRRAGLSITSESADANPMYEVQYAEGAETMHVFSKAYDDVSNPSSDFAAVMTCAHADENCPVVFGASERISLHYEDPKVADGTPQVSNVYDERVRQIASELLYAMKNV